MPKAPAAITSPKIKKLAQKAVKTPSLDAVPSSRKNGVNAIAGKLDLAIERRVSVLKIEAFDRLIIEFVQ